MPNAQGPGLCSTSVDKKDDHVCSMLVHVVCCNLIRVFFLGYARFELQVDNIPHWEEDTIYGNGLLFEVQYCPDLVQCLLADDEVIQRCRSSCVVLYYVGGQMN